MIEEWRTIEGYPNYQVSNIGRVKSLPREVKRKNGSCTITKEIILKPRKNNCGYLILGLWNNGKPKTFIVHHLVAQAFIPNPNNLPCINHIDECKTNNCVSNLEYCTYSYNNTYGTRIERVSKAQLNHPSFSKPVCQYKDGVLVHTYPSMMEAERNGFDQGAISLCCNGKLKSYMGYEWRKAI